MAGLGHLFPRYLFAFQMLVALDIGSHWVHMTATHMSGSSSHKNIDLKKAFCAAGTRPDKQREPPTEQCGAELDGSVPTTVLAVLMLCAGLGRQRSSNGLL